MPPARPASIPIGLAVELARPSGSRLPIIADTIRGAGTIVVLPDDDVTAQGAYDDPTVRPGIDAGLCRIGEPAASSQPTGADVAWRAR